jgi:hypothetical protein
VQADDHLELGGMLVGAELDGVTKAGEGLLVVLLQIQFSHRGKKIQVNQ